MGFQQEQNVGILFFLLHIFSSFSLFGWLLMKLLDLLRAMATESKLHSGKMRNPESRRGNLVGVRSLIYQVLLFESLQRNKVGKWQYCQSFDYSVVCPGRLRTASNTATGCLIIVACIAPYSQSQEATNDECDTQTMKYIVNIGYMHRFRIYFVVPHGFEEIKEIKN